MAYDDELQAQGFPENATRDDVRAAISQVLKPIQTLVGALQMGPLAFLGVVIMLAVTGHRVADADAIERAHAMSIMTVVATAFAWTLQSVLPPRVFNGTHLRRNGVVAVRSWCVMRGALAEAPALMGLVLCVISATSGAIQADPMLWLNLLPLGLQLAFNAVTFPTLDGLTEKVWERLRDGS